MEEDGSTPGIILPSADAQASLIRKVYQEAERDFADTGHFEAHGTGTAAGDPIKTSALGAAVGNARPASKPFGLAGLIKALYMLEKGVIPPQVWLDELNPRIKVDEWNLSILRELPRGHMRAFVVQVSIHLVSGVQIPTLTSVLPIII
ncbi:thiolase-like protein [Aspergillus alliaceus]|uniref:Thiolase-like protein n=1 Tax=Petromyces alliaceus TaxID=209559 RepID=A0A5N7CL36_PETAA|nr:thiolase-like protein [Aspergillus alliaceus]